MIALKSVVDGVPKAWYSSRAHVDGMEGCACASFVITCGSFANKKITNAFLLCVFNVKVADTTKKFNLGREAPLSWRTWTGFEASRNLIMDSKKLDQNSCLYGTTDSAYNLYSKYSRLDPSSVVQLLVQRPLLEQVSE